MVFGTFDVLHPGHINFFKQAKKLAQNPFLIVSVARDLNVKKIKGKNPLLKERQRLKGIARLGIVDKAVLGGKAGFLRRIVKQRPNIIALGYDQRAYTANLSQKLSKAGLKAKIIRLKSYKRKIYKSSIFKRQGGKMQKFPNSAMIKSNN